MAVVQAAPVLFDVEATVGRFETLLAKACADGAKLVVFPEAFLGGYPKGATFGATVGERTDEGRALYARYRRSAVEIPGETFEAISAAVARHQVHVVVGVIERGGHTLYCTALVIAPDGTLLARHRKLVPTGMERIIWGRGGADDLAVVDTDLGRIGLAICWENYMPLYRTWLYEQGVQIYCAPTVDMRDSWTATMRHIGVEGRCFVLSANQFAVSDDYPAGFVADAGGPVIRGGSCVVDPFGRFVAGPVFDRGEVLFADIDLDVLDGAYLDLDVVGHYARPDLFQLRTDW
ncbi:carbon-nitrogen hydrolase family protein [Actinocrispum wychmicini]|uniref:carbon-nitrogen hydrolase family protein n=1 Tax=Actinocrispum wychmicini TaxID=1213861 RepID=UPI0014049CAE|nr:carbon-nitrogen hydrolase family protein [Actinocrispum wychmicini]